MKKGIVYCLSGLQRAEMLAVSLWSLRKHYKGPVSVFAAPNNVPEEKFPEAQDTTPYSLAERLASDKRLNIKVEWIKRYDTARLPHLLCKACVFVLTPYEDTVFLDADTVVMTDPEPLFGRPLTCTGGGRCPATANQLRNLKPAGDVIRKMVNRAEKIGAPIINTGVFGFRKDHPMLWEAHHLCFGLQHRKIHDELAFNLISHRYPDVFFIDREWNTRPLADMDLSKAKILHYHQSSYYRTAEGQASFMEHFNDAFRNDVGGMREWAGWYNRYIAVLMGKRKKGRKKKIKYKYKHVTVPDPRFPVNT